MLLPPPPSGPIASPRQRRCFPALPGYFLTKIFHPNVSASGEICVNVLKRDWTPDMVRPRRGGVAASAAAPATGANSVPLFF